MKKVFLLACLSIVLFSSCSSNVDLAIDNPTKNSVEITIDTLTVMVPPKQVVWVEMGKGEHQIKLENDSIIKYNFTESLYMVNPSLSEYLMYEEYYGTEMYKQFYRSSISKKTVSFLGIEFEGNYNVIKDVINKVTWDYGPRESLPEMVQVESGESFTTLIKLYDPREFVDLMQSSSGE